MMIIIYFAPFQGQYKNSTLIKAKKKIPGLYKIQTFAIFYHVLIYKVMNHIIHSIQ